MPNPGVVFKLWTQEAAGRLVVTVNTNLGISRPAVGWGTVTVTPGTTLRALLGAQTARGVAVSGFAKRFVNDTYVVGD